MDQGDRIVIHVALLDEGTLVWRPVDAIALGNSLYQIVSENPNPDGEHWEFTTGDKVRCEERMLSRFADDRNLELVAVEKI